jgi:hypothetical protein
LRLEPFGIPFGNSDYIPKKLFFWWFKRQQGWQTYSLGPGRSGAKDDFNEANMKIAFSEFRFKILGELKGALLLMQVISGILRQRN